MRIKLSALIHEGATHNNMPTPAEPNIMRTTITLDDELLRRAQELSGLTKRSALVDEGLRALIQREATRRLARLGGSDPGATAPLRRRLAPARKRSTPQ